jgi:2-dehydro-3-deoxygluconokinase
MAGAMKSCGRLVCFGEMLVRLTAPHGERLLQTNGLLAHIGGAEANVAICVSRLGGASAMVTWLPDNPLGHGARDELRRHGVDISGVRFSHGRMGLYFLSPGAVLRPSEVLYDRAGSAFAEAAPDAIDWESALSGAAMLHISGITPAVSERAGQAALSAALAANRLGVAVSLDGNYRAKLWQARGVTGADILRSLLSTASLAFMDQRDLGLILGEPFPDRDAAAQAAFASFPRLQRVASTLRTTRGVDDYGLGATLHTRSHVHLEAPIDLPNVIDRIGGGDAFAGGLVFALLSDMPDAEALRFALFSAAAKHGQTGDASHASQADIQALLAGGSMDVKR